MPTYEYVCEACAHHWEAFQSIKDDPLKRCPNCKKQKAKRQISAGTGFILKGGGWYSDLYASAKGGSTSGESTSTPSTTSSESSTSSKSSETSKSAKADKSGSSKSSTSTSKD